MREKLTPNQTSNTSFIPRAEEMIDLMELAKVLLTYWWAILLSLIIGISAAWGYTNYMVAPTYSANALIYVNVSKVSLGNASINLTDFSNSVDLANRYTVAIESRRVLEKAIAEYDLEHTYQQLKSMVTVRAVNDTEFLSVTVTSTDPSDAAYVANAVTNALIEIMNTLVENNNAVILDTARIPSSSSGPNYRRNMMMGGLSGIVICCGMLVLLSLLDNTIKSKEDLYAKYNYPLLSAIPDHAVSPKGHSKYSKYEADDKQSAETSAQKTKMRNYCGWREVSYLGQEAYKLLRTNVEFSFAKDVNQASADGKKGRVLGITSSVPGEFKSTTAVNLALSLAEEGKRVLLLDCDLRKTELQRRLNLTGTKGISDYLVSDCRLEEILHSGVFMEHMDVMLGGTYPPNPSELLSSQRMADLVQSMAKRYDYIVVDLPPLGQVADALVAGRFCDGMLVVVREQFASRTEIDQTFRKIEYADVNLLGVILTGDAEYSGFKKYGYYKKFGYYKRYGYYKRGYGYGYGEHKRQTRRKDSEAKSSRKE